MHPLDHGMIFQEIHDFLRILHMPLHAQRQGFQALQQQERMEGRQASALVAQQGRACLNDVGPVSYTHLSSTGKPRALV